MNSLGTAELQALQSMQEVMDLTEDSDATDDEDNYFMVLGSVFDASWPADEVYDIKGSEVSRRTDQGESVMKDVNWVESGRKLRLTPNHRNRLLTAHKNDCEFLRCMGIFDYSVLLGISTKPTNDQIQRPPESLGSAVYESEDGAELFFIGLVDFVTTYKPWRLLHTTWKFLKSGGPFAGEISPMPPSYYAQRQVQFLVQEVVAGPSNSPSTSESEHDDSTRGTSS
ncbi:MAG: hypothetical protein KVP17_002766 [Porospora cf. gigantea B]|nr:MAG: hypothetical protein KVP17_002766 [Porospora cf. gigantea B]